MTSGSANPGTNGALSKAHGGFLIDGARIYGYVEGVGTGLLLSGMFKPRIRGCDIMYLQRGIQFSNLNRDVIISDNHVYACRDYGVYFDDSTDIHQLNILGNIITYCTKNIFLDNADIYNLQIVGNDIELGTYPSGVAAADKADIWINAQTSYVECVSVVGNTLEDHWTANQLIRLNGAAAGNIASVNIGDNSTGNALRDDINMGGVSNVSIGGHFKRSYGYAVRATGPIAGLKYSAGVLRSGGQGGGLFISEGAYIHRDVNMNGCQLSGDSTNGAIVVTGATSLRNFTVGNSVIYDKSATSIRLQATSMVNVRVDFNNIDNVDATDVTNAIEIAADTTLGKNSMMLNSARKGAFVAPAAFNVQGNF
nr:right-handed parallel beta-helix repeat-containing protein [Klebsiella pneumoniae]